MTSCEERAYEVGPVGGLFWTRIDGHAVRRGLDKRWTCLGCGKEYQFTELQHSAEKH